MSKWICRLWLIVMVMGVSGVAHANYRLTYNKWTRHAESFDIETAKANIIWNATYFSESYVKERNKKAAKIGIDSYQPSGHEFVVQIFAPSDASLFNMTEASFWKTWLTTADGETVSPIEIMPIPTTPLSRILYPKVDRWSKLYLVRFPTVDLGKKWSLTMKAVTAQSTLSW